MEKGKRAKLIQEITKIEKEMIVLMQEMKSWKDSVVGHFRIFSKQPNKAMGLTYDCGIAVPKPLQNEV